MALRILTIRLLTLWRGILLEKLSQLVEKFYHGNHTVMQKM